MRVAIYSRVSTANQSCEMQLLELREYTQRRGWVTSGEYVDKGWSGAKANRPELDLLMRDASLRRSIPCWSGSWTAGAAAWRIRSKAFRN